MKKMILVFLFATMLTACINNYQASSAEEAKYVVKSLPDFQESIQYFSVQSSGLIYADRPSTYQSEPPLDITSSVYVVHEIIYKTKEGGFKLVLLNDARPPNVVLTREIK